MCITAALSAALSTAPGLCPSQTGHEPSPAAGWHGIVGSSWLPPTQPLEHLCETNTAENHMPSPPGEAAVEERHCGVVIRHTLLE